MEENFEEEDFLILIVDDIAKNIQLLGKVLDNKGYRVAAVTNGEQAIKAARKHAPDLILLDIMMPGKSGFEVCEELKADDKLSEIPVIFLTARSEDEDVVKGLNMGGADYVTKPFNAEELLARIETHLSLKEARDQIIKQSEELKQLSQTKDKLYSIIAHDLKGAVFGISGMTEMLQLDLEGEQVDQKIKHNISLVHQAAHSANQILENLLAWTRMQTNLLEVSPSEFSLSECIKDCIELYKAKAKGKGVQIEFESENVMLSADREMISTIFRNLISNAIKYSRSGDRISIELESGENHRTIAVEDEGLGMPEEVRQNIFNPQKRPRRKGTEQEEGTGLGLLLCKEFVELHNGEITVESEPEEGTVFRIILPVKSAA